MKTISVNKTSSKGIVIGKAYVVQKEDLAPSTYEITQGGINEEISKFDQARNKAIVQLEKLNSEFDIFAGHLMIAQDMMLRDSIINKINELKNIEVALSESIAEFVMIFESMEDEYMRERSADVKDVGNRLLRILKGLEHNQIADIKEEVILLAEYLTPSDTAVMDFQYVTGIITELGGVTSHVSIIARNIGLPALVGVNGILKQVKNNDVIIMDATEGTIILDPDETTIEHYHGKKAQYQEQQKRLETLKDLPAVTLDGTKVELYANVGNIEDVKQAVQYNAEGIGLFRSEFLYMENTHFPTEEEQFKAYKKAAELCNGEVIIRTLDIGGDKALSYYRFDHEENRFLGWRGIRISLDLEDVFKNQLRAILRASHFGNLKIMFPMIISIEEWIAANEVLQQCMQELRTEKVAFNENIEVGIMVETPAAVINIKEFAKRVDFFSIGTNDLTQYLLAVDRGNQKISKLYNSFHPAVLQSINNIIEAGHKHNIKVGMCGEFASDPKAVRLLLGMGLDEFSMSVREIASVKDIIRNTNYKEAVRLVKKVLAVDTISQVMDLL